MLSRISSRRGVLSLSSNSIYQSKPAPSRSALEIVAFAKRAIDLFGSFVVLVPCAPLFAFLIVLVVLDGGPAFYAQKRVGRGGRAFWCLKFRTMVVGAEECLTEYLYYHPEAAEEWEAYHKLSIDPRITGIGRVLRKTCLDEVPQMWNVLRGQMSLVGPRPVTPAEMEQRYGAYAPLVTSVRPGVTGPWQIMPKRNQIDYPQRVRMDASYAAQVNLVTDMHIVAKTVSVVLNRNEPQ